MSRKIERVFDEVSGFVSSKVPILREVQLWIGCPLAEQEHRYSKRQYMHVNHVPGTICCSREASKLPMKYILGIFLHEFGHLIRPGDEYDADKAVLDAFDCLIKYTGKQDLQEITT